MSKIKLLGVSIETLEIEIEEADYQQAKRDDAVGDELDVYLSNMDGVTLVLEPDGTAVAPYGNSADLLKALRPLLDRIDPWHLNKYSTLRMVEVSADHAGEYEAKRASGE